MLLIHFFFFLNQVKQNLFLIILHQVENRLHGFKESVLPLNLKWSICAVVIDHITQILIIVSLMQFQIIMIVL